MKKTNIFTLTLSLLIGIFFSTSGIAETCRSMHGGLPWAIVILDIPMLGGICRYQDREGNIDSYMVGKKKPISGPWVRDDRDGTIFCRAEKPELCVFG
ncbi:MAG: hypothetical protein ACNA7Y_00905 [Gammaproteobacteria bacterium]